MMIGTVRGVSAVVRHGYHAAAQVGDWTVSRLEGGSGWSLVATVRSSDGFRMTQRPLTFEARHATGAWRWPVHALRIEGASLTATLGPMEKPDVEVRAT